MSDIFHNLSIEVQKGDTGKVQNLVKAAIDQGIAPIKILENGLRPGMEEIGRKFETLEVYLPDMILAGDAMTAGVDILRPHLRSGEDKAGEGLILLGTIEGVGAQHDNGPRRVLHYPLQRAQTVQPRHFDMIE